MLLQMQEAGLVYLLTRKVGNAAMRALMVMPLPVQGQVGLLARSDTTVEDWNARCRMDAPPSWLSTSQVSEAYQMEEKDEDDSAQD